MPNMDGYTATQQIRKMNNRQQLPIIAMTANVMKGDRQKALDSGMNDHIAKPINIETMFITLGKWLIKHKAHDVIPSPLLTPHTTILRQRIQCYYPA